MTDSLGVGLGPTPATRLGVGATELLLVTLVTVFTVVQVGPESQQHECQLSVMHARQLTTQPKNLPCVFGTRMLTPVC